MAVTGIVLAAGSSRRFGADKRQYSLPSGRNTPEHVSGTVLEAVITLAARCLEEVRVVLRDNDDRYAAALEKHFQNPSIHWVCAPDSTRGMAHSLAHAMTGIRGTDAVMIFLGDMPWVTEETVRALLHTWKESRSGTPIIVPTLNGRKGHPVTFHHRYFRELEELTGDEGARRLLSLHPQQVIEVAVDDPGILKDIDVPEDLSPV